MQLPHLSETLTTLEGLHQQKAMELRELEALMRGLERLRDGTPITTARQEFVAQITEQIQRPATVSTPTVPKSNEWANLSVTAATAKLIEELGPLDTRVIAETLVARGVRTKSTNFIPVVYSSLKESPRFFRNVDTKKWEIAKDPMAPRLVKGKKGAKKNTK
jgi:ribosomal protein L28